MTTEARSSLHVRVVMAWASRCIATSEQVSTLEAAARCAMTVLA